MPAFAKGFGAASRRSSRCDATRAEADGTGTGLRGRLDPEVWWSRLAQAGIDAAPRAVAPSTGLHRDPSVHHLRTLEPTRSAS